MVRAQFSYAVRGYVVPLACSPDVAVDYDLAVDCHLDAVAFHADLLGAPFSKGFVDDPLGGDHSVHGAMDLVLAEPAGVLLGVMVEDLDLAHSVVGGVDADRSPDAYPVVDTLRKEAELETVDEVAVLLRGVEIACGSVTG